MKYRKKPVVVNAVKWNGNIDEIINALQVKNSFPRFPYLLNGELIIPTLEGTMKANIGDYIIRGIANELYPCKPEIFEASYEKVEEDLIK